jgi:hypothetical protein
VKEKNDSAFGMVGSVMRALLHSGVKVYHPNVVTNDSSSKADLCFTLKLLEMLQADRRYVVTADIVRNGMKCGEVSECIDRSGE